MTTWARRAVRRGSPDKAAGTALEPTGAASGPSLRNLFLPVDYESWPVKRLTWAATLNVTGLYYAVIEILQLRVLVQAVPWGLHIRHPGPAGETAVTEVAIAGLHDGAPHRWSVEHSKNSSSILLVAIKEADRGAKGRGPAQV